MIGLPKADVTHLAPAGIITHRENFNAYNLLINPPPTCSITSPGTTVASLNNKSWGQSFVANCTGSLTTVAFNSADALSSGVSLSIKEGLIVMPLHYILKVSEQL